MPELPEVETSRRGILPHIEGVNVIDMIVRHPQLRWPIPLEAAKKTRNKTLLTVKRRGKYLQLMFDDGYWLVHLGMSGNLRIVENDVIAKKHDHVDMVFSNGKILRYNDPRRFGCWLFQEGANNTHKLLADLGPEPLEYNFDTDYLYAASRGKNTPIKSFIMNSHIVVGVGNIYASEALFMAGINPKRSAGKVSEKRYNKLVIAIKQVLQQSIENGGTTLKDFVGSDGKPGYFQQALNVYGLAGTPCKQCQTPIKKWILSNRSTYYCSFCQR